MRWGLRPQPEPREITREEVASYQRDRLVFALACSLAAGRTGFHEEAPTQEDYEQAEALVAPKHPSKSPPEPADEAPSWDALSGS
jgi:acyl-CoA thioesterase